MPYPLDAVAAARIRIVPAAATAARLAGGVAAIAAAASARADDSCRFAGDQVCDEPDVCAPGTDSADCAGHEASSPASFDSDLSGFNPFEVWTTLPASSVLLALALLAAAVFVALRRLGAPRSGRIALALLLLAVAQSGLGMLPHAFAFSLYELSGGLGLSADTLLIGIGLALLAWALWRNATDAGTAPTLTEAVPIASLSPDIRESDGGEISQARELCRRSAERLDAALRGHEGRLHLYAQYDAAAQPWLQVDCLASDARGAFVSSLRMVFKPQPFGLYPVTVDIEVDDRGRRRRIGDAIDVDDGQIDKLAQCLLGDAQRFQWEGRRLRQWSWQFWRPRQRRILLESPFAASMRANVRLLVALAIGALLLAALMAAPLIVGLALVVGVAAWRHWHVPPPAYRVTALCPPRPPRRLRALDSWQAVVRDLGSQRENVVDRLEAVLRERMAGTDEPVAVRRENIWYEGADGKVERQQLTVSLRRAIVFIRIYQYGGDLFVGWDAHVNQIAWKEQKVEVGHRDSDGLKVHLIGVETQALPINEYDITDANFLLEATHVHLSALLRQVLREREIDQELDFTIVRESRQALIGSAAQDAARPRRQLFARA